LWGTTIPRDNHLAAAGDLDALAERCAFDDQLASERKRLAAGSWLKAGDRVDGQDKPGHDERGAACLSRHARELLKS
jgi:hypothetical protein